jgi:hypothetical protein
MSKLVVAPELIVSTLFAGTQPEVRIIGAGFDVASGLVLLEIEGPGVPDAEEVLAVCHAPQSMRVEFQAR